jgi:ethanolamine transporter
MGLVGDIVIYILMGFVLIGAVGAMINPREGVGKEFMDGLYSIGPIFVPVAGIMVSIPYLSQFVRAVIAPVYGLLGADPALAATTFIAVDMGGYQLAEATALTTDGWIMAMMVGFTAGACIVYIIPVGLAMLDIRDHKYMALGIMSGILTVPIAMLVTTWMLIATGTKVRPEISTTAESTHAFAPSAMEILTNTIPLAIIVVVLAFLLWKFPNMMIRAFMAFGKFMDIGVKTVLAIAIVEYFTGIFSKLLAPLGLSWGFDPLIADTEDQFRALEIAGYIGIMLAGAFPLVWAINTYLRKPLAAAGSKFGISSEGSAGVLAAATNPIALFHLVRSIPPKDKVLTIAFCVTAGALVGDHLAFSANFQPNMIVPLMVGKVVAGVLGMLIAQLIAVPTARRLEADDRQGTSEPSEYLASEAGVTPSRALPDAESERH